MKKQISIFILFFVAQFIFAQRYIVQVKANETLDTAQIFSFAEKKCQIRKINEQLNLYSILAENEANSERFFQFLSKSQNVIYSQIDHRATLRTQPNDSLFSSQWDMNKINLQKVWEKNTGGLTTEGDTIVVGIIETDGFDYRHPDLLPNIWKNQAEIPNNNIDDDQNGYKDDFFGLNILTKNDKHQPFFHGTSVAGIIGAKGDNHKGVTGVNWNVKMMLISECGFESEIIEGYSYMLNQRKLYNETKGKKGAFVVVSNASWGFRGKKASELPLLCAMYDELGKVGILNISATDNLSTDVDKTFDVPSNCTSDFLIVVTNTDRFDKLYQTAAFGKKSVDMSAPGDKSFTVGINNSYTNFGACSAATPHVAGAVALLYSTPSPQLLVDCKKKPSETALFLKEVILNGTTQLADLKDVTTSGGRLNVFQSQELLLQKYSPIEKVEFQKVFPNPALDDLEIEFSTNSFKAHELFIFNTLGQIIQYETFTPSNLGAAKHKIKVDSIAKGVYFLSLNQKGKKERIVAKFVKM
jgi:hypothetical protein